MHTPLVAGCGLAASQIENKNGCPDWELWAVIKSRCAETGLTGGDGCPECTVLHLLLLPMQARGSYSSLRQPSPSAWAADWTDQLRALLSCRCATHLSRPKCPPWANTADHSSKLGWSPDPVDDGEKSCFFGDKQKSITHCFDLWCVAFFGRLGRCNIACALVTIPS